MQRAGTTTSQGRCSTSCVWIALPFCATRSACGASHCLLFSLACRAARHRQHAASQCPDGSCACCTCVCTARWRRHFLSMVRAVAGHEAGREVALPPSPFQTPMPSQPRDFMPGAPPPSCSPPPRPNKNLDPLSMHGAGEKVSGPLAFRTLRPEASSLQGLKPYSVSPP